MISSETSQSSQVEALLSEKDNGTKSGFLDRPDVWRVLILAAGVLLAICYFLPIWQPALSPAQLTLVEIDQWSNPHLSFVDHFDAFCALVGGYVFGGLMAAGAAARLLRRPKLAQFFSIAMAVLLTAVGLGVLWSALAFQEYEITSSFPLPLVASLILAVGTLAYVLSASRSRSNAFVCYEFAGSIAIVWWFAFSWTVNQYAPLLPFVASVALLVGTIGEAHLTLHRSWRDTEWLLMTCLFSKCRSQKDPVIA